MAATAQQRRALRRKYDRLYRHVGGTKVVVVSVPDDVERREDHVPCFNCGVRADVACRHRPWMLAR